MCHACDCNVPPCHTDGCPHLELECEEVQIKDGVTRHLFPCLVQPEGSHVCHGCNCIIKPEDKDVSKPPNKISPVKEQHMFEAGKNM